MDYCCSCLLWKRKCGGLRYEVLRKEDDDFDDQESEEVISVIVGKEKRVFAVEAYVLEEKPFRVLMETTKCHFSIEERALFVNNVDSILFDHMLWLFHNDSSSSSKFCWNDIIDFYSDDSES